MVQVGINSGPLADDCKSKKKLKEQKNNLLNKAEGNNVTPMEELAENYSNRSNGFKKDDKSELTWSKRAHHAGSTRSSREYGLKLLERTTQENTAAIVALTKAASKGDRTTTYCLGDLLASSCHGPKAHLDESTFWLRESLKPSSESYCQLSQRDKDLARHTLTSFDLLHLNSHT